MVGIDREGHELIERYLLVGIGFQQRFRDRGELEALLDDADRDEEGGRDLFLGLTFLAHRLEGAELIERMERRPLDVLRKAVLLGEAFGADDAGHGRGAVEATLLHQEFERPVTAPAGGHLEHAGLLAGFVKYRPDREARQQRAAGDVLGELLD